MADLDGIRPAQDCADMTELRQAIDGLDRELVRLLVIRAGYIDRAAAIKAEVALPARITARVEEVVANVRSHASAGGLDPALVELLWRQLIEWSISREETSLGPDQPLQE